MKTIRIGFIPLVDAAIAIAAVECDFAEREGLKIELVREVSWANIRDKLAAGYLRRRSYAGAARHRDQPGAGPR